jgi:indolepyruvate decarboxylase
MWQYSKLPETFDKGSFGIGIRATTEEELAAAVQRAMDEPERLVLIEAVIPGRDCSTGLERLGESFRKAQQKS